jgi:N-acyl-D-aspartate/D-glutamate deacylase
MDGTIGSIAGGHPRSFGSFTRKIAYYVREREVITLPFAIRAATGLPAQIIGLSGRGYVRKGQQADIVIFDYDRIEDRATALEPDRHSEGIEFLLVNGALAIDNGAFTDALNGVVIRRNKQDR